MSVTVVTGIMAVGKSTVAELLAQRFERGVHVRGDVFRRMVVSGRADMTPDANSEARRQLDLRYRLAAHTADEYWRAGFDVVVQDNLIGEALPHFVSMVEARPLYVVVLTADSTVIAEREAGRPKTGYGTWTVEQLSDTFTAETPRLGLWIDTSRLTPDQTVDAIIRRRDEALVR